MAYINKTFLKCDRCGEAREVAFEERSTSRKWMACRSAEDEGWCETSQNHHLCPRCAAPYLAKKRELETELERLSGEISVQVTL